MKHLAINLNNLTENKKYDLSVTEGNGTIDLKGWDGFADASGIQQVLLSGTGLNKITTEMIEGYIDYIEKQKLLASDAFLGDMFGEKVSLSGDYCIASARLEDPNDINNAGSAYIFHQSGGIWSEQQKLSPDDANAGDAFGQSVCIDGDTCAIGSLSNDEGEVNSGAVYIYVRSGTVWSLQQKVQGLSTGSSDQFGISVSLEGDYLVVGAESTDETFTGSGSAYIFTRSGTVWTEQQEIFASDPSPNSYFGCYVAINGTSLIVGSRIGGVDNTGTAYVFTRSGSVWTEQQRLISPDAEEDDSFGASVCIDGDTCIVGANAEDTVGANAGSAYVFVRSGSVWTFQQKIQPFDVVAGDRFSYDVTIEGNRCVFSSHFADSNNVAEGGSAYIYDREGTVWSQVQKLEPSSSEVSGRFSRTVDIEGDTIMLGVYSTDDDGSNSGSFYIFKQE